MPLFVLVWGCSGPPSALVPPIDRSTELVVVRTIDKTYLDSLLGSERSPAGGGDLLGEPQSVAMVHDGEIIFADRVAGRLVHLELDARERGRRLLVATTGALLREPRVVRLDPIGNAYVSEAGDGMIGVFDPRLRLVEWLPTPPYEALGLVPGRTVGIAFGPLGAMYLTDEVNGRLYRYDASGQFDAAVGSDDNPWGQLTHPAGVACAPLDGSVYVCDPGQRRIVVFDAGGTPETLIGENDLSDPQAVAVNHHGQCLVVDRGLKALLIFTRRGDLLRRIDGDRLVPGGLVGPTDLYLSDSTLWIADPPGRRILEVRVRHTVR
ncbi:MAG TPA: NHL repeat-containing protein [Acidobacteriota bacterium]|nr:NHL repeat-containing protein [Acidobacteriota bacterium]